MNEQDNIGLIRTLYTAFKAGDLNTIMDRVSDNVEWTNYGPSTIPYAGTRTGKSQVEEFFRIIADTTTGGTVTPENFVAAGDVVVATGRYSARVRSTGTQIDTPVAHLFTIRNGKVVRWEGFSDTAKVAEAHTVRYAAGR